MATLRKRFISFILICLSISNSIVILISHLTISNPLYLVLVKNYRSVIGADGELNNSISIIKVLEKCTKNLIGHSRLAFNNHESNFDC